MGMAANSGCTRTTASWSEAAAALSQRAAVRLRRCCQAAAAPAAQHAGVKLHSGSNLWLHLQHAAVRHLLLLHPSYSTPGL